MVDLNDVVVFAAVARDRSFTKAAQALGMPKSTVSERVARLEARLGVRLLERTTRSLRLTASGADYVARIAHVVQELEDAEAAVTAAHKTPRGVLRVGSPLIVARVFLADVVSEYLARYPDVQVELVVGDRQFDIVEESLDVAIHVIGALDAQLVARKLGTGQRVCVASPKYLREHGAPATLREAVGHAWVANGPSRNVTWTFERDGETSAIAILARYAVTSVELVYRAVLEGVGIAVLPTFLCASDLANGKLVRVLDDWSPGESTIHLVYPSHRHLAARVRAFVDLVIERLPNLPSQPGVAASSAADRARRRMASDPAAVREDARRAR